MTFLQVMKAGFFMPYGKGILIYLLCTGAGNAGFAPACF